MRKVAIAFAQVVLGVVCVAGVSRAGPLPPVSPAPATLPFTSSFQMQLLDTPVSRHSQSLPSQDNKESSFDLGKVAYRLSYLGAILLTADRVVHSVNSVRDRMEYTCPDGTCFRFSMEPHRRGLEVSLKMSHPLRF